MFNVQLSTHILRCTCAHLRSQVPCARGAGLKELAKNNRLGGNGSREAAAAHTSPAASSKLWSPLLGAITIAYRENPPEKREAYIQHKIPGESKRFLLGVSASQTPAYKELVRAIAYQATDGVHTKEMLLKLRDAKLPKS